MSRSNFLYFLFFIFTLSGCRSENPDSKEKLYDCIKRMRQLLGYIPKSEAETLCYLAEFVNYQDSAQKPFNDNFPVNFEASANHDMFKNMVYFESGPNSGGTRKFKKSKPVKNLGRSYVRRSLKEGDERYY